MTIDPMPPEDRAARFRRRLSPASLMAAIRDDKERAWAMCARPVNQRRHHMEAVREKCRAWQPRLEGV